MEKEKDVSGSGEPVKVISSDESKVNKVKLHIQTVIAEHMIDYEGVLLSDTIKVTSHTLAKSGELYKRLVSRKRKIGDRCVNDETEEIHGRKVNHVTISDLDKNGLKVFEADWKTLWMPDLNHEDAHEYAFLAEDALKHINLKVCDSQEEETSIVL